MSKEQTIKVLAELAERLPQTKLKALVKVVEERSVRGQRKMGGRHSSCFQ